MRRAAAHGRLATQFTVATTSHRGLIASLLVCLFAAFAAVATFAAGSASATALYQNADQITIPKSGEAAPYPSMIDVEGQSGVITDVTVTLHRFSHDAPNDVDVLLVSPDGDSSIVMSDACGHEPVTNATWVLGDTAPDPMTGTCDQLVYKPTDNPGGFTDQFTGDALPGRTRPASTTS